MNQPGGAPALLEVASLSKHFGGEAALVNVGLTLRIGEIRGLLGANGSGKSTLIKILAGYHRADDGSPSIRVNGSEVDPTHAGGIPGFRFIHQDLGLVPEMSVVDNLMMGSSEGAALVRPRPARLESRRARELIETYGLTFTPATLVRDLPAADRTMVALMRALRDRESTKVLVLDEVTATLPPRETNRVLDAVRKMRDCGVLFVSHRMEEILELCDTATVLRSGRSVADIEVAASSERELVELVTGRPVGEIYPEVPRPDREVTVAVRGLSGGAVADVNFEVHRGEMVGIASLDPVESATVLGLIFGSRLRTSGDVILEGEPLDAAWGPAETTHAGVAMVTDRLLSSIPSFKLRENITVNKLRSVSGRWRLNARRERLIAAELISAFGILPPDPEGVFARLSGGNQQKAVLARSMSIVPRLLLLDDPTRGVDVGAKAAMYRTLREASERGLAVLIGSTDFEELASLCNRVIVLRGGRVSAVLAGTNLTAHDLLDRCYAPASTAAAT